MENTKVPKSELHTEYEKEIAWWSPFLWVIFTSYIPFLLFLGCSRTSQFCSFPGISHLCNFNSIVPLQQEPGKAPEAADLGQQLCRAVSWESSHQCWTLSKAAFTSVCVWVSFTLLFTEFKDKRFNIVIKLLISDFSKLHPVKLNWVYKLFSLYETSDRASRFF